MKKASLRFILVYFFALILGSGFRLFPLFNHVRGDSEEKATLYIIAKTRENIHQQVVEKYPKLTKSQDELLEQKLFDEHLRANGAEVRRQIDDLSQEIGAKSTEGRAYPYLLASDSYYYYSLTERILTKGAISDSIKGNKYLNELMLAPDGFWEPLNLHPYLGAYWTKFLRIFDPSIDTMLSVSMVSMIITAVSLAVFVLLCAQLQFSAPVTAVAASFFLLAPIHLKRSMFAWYDNDTYNILFPLLILYFLFKALRQTDIRRALLGILVVVFIFGAYAYFWQGWIFLLVILLAALGLMVLANIFPRDQQALKKYSLSFLMIALGAFGLTAILFGSDAFVTLFQEGLTALSGFITPQLSNWPDLYISVSELHRSDNGFIIDQLGGAAFMVIAMAGFLYCFFTCWKKEKQIPLTLVVYALATLVIAVGAQRFVLLMVVPFSLAFCYGLQLLSRVLQRLMEALIKGPIGRSFIPFLAGAALFLLILFPVFRLKDSMRALLNPLFNQTWENALIKIKNETPPNSIVTTWWAPGHFIKAIAQRAVTFDGATINVPQAYWVANFFLATDEKQALGILRMLNTGSNKAVEAFQSMGLDLANSVLAVEDIVVRPREEARSLLTGVLHSKVNAELILNLTHNTPPPSYILIYNEFVENNIQLKFIGDWNFRVIQALNKNPEEFKKVVPNPNSDEFIQFLWKLAGGPSKYSGVLAQISENESNIYFQENVTLQKDSMVVYVDSPKFGKGFVQSIFYAKDGRLEERKIPPASLPYCAVLFERDGHKSIILLDRALAESMLVRLYFLDGAGLEHFKPFVRERDMTGRTQISVFEVDWAGY